MPRKKILKDEHGEDLFEVESAEWYAVKGHLPPEKWNWKDIKKEWNKLKMPKDVAYDLFHIPMEYNKRCGYYMLLSKRGVGKTTSVMLLGLILFKLYGVQIQYIRQTEDMLKPKFAQELMSTILSCGYIKTLTEGRWNYAYYYANKWVFANIDGDGHIVEKTSLHFCYTLSIDQSFTYKSNYNAPNGNFTVFDEFIGKRYTQNEFVYYLDILSTIIRKRSGVINFMLSNNIDEFSEYFEEFEIYDQIREMKAGECDIAETPGGTRIYVEKINIHDKNAARLNAEYFGFKNPRLYAITGAGEWNVALCKHYDFDDEVELIDRTHYIKMGYNLVNLELCRSGKYGYICRVHKATRIHEDSIVYTMDMIEDKRYRQGKGHSRVDAFIWGLLRAGLWHYATNSQKNFVDKYVSICYGFK
jgi:hypothetical protein